MKFRTYILFPTVTYGVWKLAEHVFINEDARMSFEQRCRKYGYDTERHFVTTEDGYILQIFRLVNKNHANTNSNQPVLLQHGMCGSGMRWVDNKEKSPAIYLANQGFDVWIGNNRGNIYSKFHKTLVPDVDSKYWEFSFEEMGIYDTKAMLKHINNETKKKITYIGFSQGGTQLYYGLTHNNEWFKNHLNLVITLASPIKKINPLAEIDSQINLMNITRKVLERLINTPYTSKFWKKLNCIMLKLYPEYGRTYLDYKAEAKPELNDPNSWQCKCIDFPDILSPKTGNHWYQQIMSSKARRYDYGEEENIKRYGSKEAPEINTSSIRDIPIALFFGKYDLVVQSNEVQFTIDHLDPSVIKHYEECESGHHTFLLGKDVSYLDSIQKLIREYSK